MRWGDDVDDNWKWNYEQRNHPKQDSNYDIVIMKYYRYSYLYVDKISLSLYVNDVVSIVRILIRHD